MSENDYSLFWSSFGEDDRRASGPVDFGIYRFRAPWWRRVLYRLAWWHR